MERADSRVEGVLQALAGGDHKPRGTSLRDPKAAKADERRDIRPVQETGGGSRAGATGALAYLLGAADGLRYVCRAAAEGAEEGEPEDARAGDDGGYQEEVGGNGQ